MAATEINREELKKLFVEEAKHFLSALKAGASVPELQKIRMKIKTLIYAMEDAEAITKEDFDKLREIISH